MMKETKRKLLKAALFILFVANYALLIMRFIWWLLDDKYGLGERVRNAISNKDIQGGYTALNQMYSEITYDVLYCAVFTFIIFLLFAVILGTYRKDGDEK